MPQMAPMLWFILFFYFIVLISLLSELVFFQISYKQFNKINDKKYSNLCWKW
uniref:ATP synthase complex subunit 8 n=2 Tax=Hyalella TaxID=199487 RepID=A0A7T8V7B1_9CRUS|nr:ATP synthase F0 subunit 8 [Hyalella sp. n. 1 FZ-2021]QQQ88792.1 ATP synthase F0 subunit 8 [Hyalella armata]